MTSNVLILCTHNSARSVLGEGMLNYWANRLGKNIRTHSEGSAPSGWLNPFAMEALDRVGVDVSRYRSKGREEFTGPDSPVMRIVATVCDSAAAEFYPSWSGSPVQVLGLSRSVPCTGWR